MVCRLVAQFFPLCQNNFFTSGIIRIKTFLNTFNENLNRSNIAVFHTQMQSREAIKILKDRITILTLTYGSLTHFLRLLVPIYL